MTVNEMLIKINKLNLVKTGLYELIDKLEHEPVPYRLTDEDRDTLYCAVEFIEQLRDELGYKKVV